MNQYQSVIQLARQSALKRFSVLVMRVAQNSDQELAKALAVYSPDTDYSTLNAARYFLRKAGDELLQNLQTRYQQKMDQAFDALNSDQRPEICHFTAETLTLIDDSIINREIEVGHLVGRLSASCSESLGLVNLIMSQLLGKTEVREKDNPFRPDLMAYTLQEVLFDMVHHEGVRNFMLNYSTNSLAIYLPEYYVELCEIFKAGGISPKTFTRPTSANPYLAEQHARPTSEKRIASQKQEQQKKIVEGARQAGLLPDGPVAPELLPMLQRILSLMQQQSPPAAQGHGANQSPDPVHISPVAAFQGLVNNLYGSAAGNQSGSPGVIAGGGAGTTASGPAPAGASPQLLALLNEFQRLAANAGSADESSATATNQLLSISEKLDETNASHSERMALDLVGVLFELLGRDEQIPPGLRAQMARLQIPFLKSAVLDPGTLEQVDHPTRKLLNHMGMVSVGTPEESAYGKDVDTEIRRIVKTILADFDNDTGIFVTCLDELKSYLGAQGFTLKTVLHEDVGLGTAIFKK